MTVMLSHTDGWINEKNTMPDLSESSKIFLQSLIKEKELFVDAVDDKFDDFCDNSNDEFEKKI